MLHQATTIHGIFFEYSKENQSMLKNMLRKMPHLTSMCVTYSYEAAGLHYSKIDLLIYLKEHNHIYQSRAK